MSGRGSDALVAGDVKIEFMGNFESTPCRECRAGRPHCHGTLIRHSGQAPQCTEPDCSHPEVLLHSLTIDCEALGCDCGVESQPIGSAARRASSTG